jgi:CheY-like chemotaxis protein
MLVDDEDFNLQALQFLTKRYGFSSVLAYNGKEAVERVRDKMLNKCCSSCVIFRVIMMDINMPFMDGW